MDIPDPAADRHGAEDDSSCADIAYVRACALVAEGYDLTAVAAHDGLPAVDTLRRWLTENDDFRARYERARPAREDKWTADVVALVDSLAGEKRAGVRLRVEARKWRLAVLQKDSLKTTSKAADKPSKSGAAVRHGSDAEEPEAASRAEIISAHLQAVLDGKFDTPIERLETER